MKNVWAQQLIGHYRFNPIDHPVIWEFPERNTPISDWWGHIPFAKYVVSALKPELFVELGVFHGDSFCAICQAIRTLSLPTRCVGIDAWIGSENENPATAPDIDSVMKFVKDRYDFAELRRSLFDDQVESFDDNSISLLHIDGNHSLSAVTHDFESWLPKLAERGIILFHDIAIGGIPQYGVDEFWRGLKDLYPHFEFDHSWGLGVLAPKGIPEGLMGLFAATGTPDEEKIQTFFQLMGSRSIIQTMYRHQYGDSTLIRAFELPAFSGPTIVGATADK